MLNGSLCQQLYRNIHILIGIYIMSYSSLRSHFSLFLKYTKFNMYIKRLVIL